MSKKNFCLLDTWNSANNGQAHCIYTPHYNPQDDDVELEETDNPDFEFNVEYFWDEVSSFDRDNKLAGFIITGQLGLWNGKPSITPVFHSTLKGALRACANKMDQFRVDIQKGVIYAYGYHHDGINSFTIKGIGTSRMSELQKDRLDQCGNGECVYDDELLADRHTRQIQWFKVLGFDRLDSLTPAPPTGGAYSRYSINS